MLSFSKGFSKDKYSQLFDNSERRGSGGVLITAAGVGDGKSGVERRKEKRVTGNSSFGYSVSGYPELNKSRHLKENSISRDVESQINLYIGRLNKTMAVVRDTDEEIARLQKVLQSLYNDTSSFGKSAEARLHNLRAITNVKSREYTVVKSMF
jgi:hypothetical protein